MKTGLTSGVGASSTITVDRARTIDFLGEQLRVYATPELVRDFEIACRTLLGRFCEANEDSVGTAVNLTHSGATLLGMSVQMDVKVMRVDGRTVTYAISARDGVEEIAAGEHSRVIVDVNRLRAKVAAKAEKLRAM
jgi:fluoroacetyl-CoA thioesterase